MTNNLSHICNARPGAIALNFKDRIVMCIRYRHSLFHRLVAGVLMLGVALNATANPTGMRPQPFRHRRQQRFTAHRHHDFAKHLP